MSFEEFEWTDPWRRCLWMAPPRYSGLLGGLGPGAADEKVSKMHGSS
jgi:hypothetical protein